MTNSIHRAISHHQWRWRVKAATSALPISFAIYRCVHGRTGFVWVGIILLLTGLFPSCRASEAADAQEIVADNTAFALDLYGTLKNEKGNLFFFSLQHFDCAGDDDGRGA